MSGEIAPKSREEVELEKAVFGDSLGFESELSQLGLEDDAENDASGDEDSENAGGSDDDLYFIDKGDDENSSDRSNEPEDSDSSDEDEDVQVWRDSDDEDTQVDLTSSHRSKKLRKYMDEDKVSGRDYTKRLRSHFEKLYPKPRWAAAELERKRASSDSESDEMADNDEPVITASNPLRDTLSKKTNYITQNKLKLLPTSDLDIQRVADVTKQLQSQAVVQTIEFHPTQPLVLTSGFDRTLRIYQIDGKINPLASSLYIDNCPFRTAVFHPDGKRVFASGRRRYMFIWNLEDGSVEKISRLYGHEHTQSSFEKFILSPKGEYIALVGDNGWLNLLSADSGQWVSGAKIDGEIVDVAWTEPNLVTIVNSQGELWTWDASSRQMVSRWRDPSLVGVTKIAQSTNWIALGMDNGMVSIYDRRNPLRGMRYSDTEPEIWQANRVIENLVTSISSMRFSPDGQMLVIASKLKRDSLRIVHVPSFSVFKNWPTSSTPLGHVSCVAWSPQNQMLAAGNEGGFARLWTLNHYS